MTRDQQRSLVLNSAVVGKLEADPAAVIDRARHNLSYLLSVHRYGPVVESLEAWAKLLDGPVGAIEAVLTSESEEAMQLRQNSPFAGVLTPAERAAALAEFGTVVSR